MVPVIILCCLLAAVLLIHHALRLRVTVNDQRITIWRGTTIEHLLDKGYADPTPGNLLAVDGSVLAEGKGRRASATINGKTVKLATRVPRGATVVIGDGKDVEEKSEVTEETITPGTRDDDRSFGGEPQGKAP